MNNLNEYKNRFYTLMESTIGDVKPLIDEQSVDDTKPLFDFLKSAPIMKLWEETKTSLDELNGQLKTMVNQVVSEYPEKKNESEKVLARFDSYFSNVKKLKYDKLNTSSIATFFIPQINKGYVKFTGSLAEDIFNKISNTLNYNFKNTEENIIKIKTHIDNSTKYLKGLKFV